MNEASTVRLATYAMATRFELVIHGDDSVRLRAAGEEAIAEIDWLATQLSFYDPTGEVAWLNSGARLEPAAVTPDLFELLETAARVTDQTDGAFDVTIAPLLRIWGFTGDSGLIPTDEEIEAARQLVGMGLVELEPVRRTVRFARDGVMMDLGAIGKGFAIEKAVEILREAGITSALIHGGTSTVYALGSPPNQSVWRVALGAPSPLAEEDCGAGKQTPSPLEGEGWGEGEKKTPSPQGGEGWGEGGNLPAIVDLIDSSISVSAPHGKSFVEHGQEYGHIIDARTGRPTQGARMAAVTGPSPTLTDALSTALLVLGAGWLPELEKRFPGYKGTVDA